MKRQQRKRGRPARVTGAISDRRVSVRVSEAEHAALIVTAQQHQTDISCLVRVRLADVLAS